MEKIAIITFVVGVIVSTPPTLGQVRKVVCLDNLEDVRSSLWTATGVEISSASSVTALPKGFGDLKGLSNGSNDIWYMEGPSSSSQGSKDITFKSPLNLYPSRARSVSIYIKYYTNSGRRLSLYPVKEGGAGSPGTLQLLPLPPKGSGVGWIEIRKEIDPTESPLEITCHLEAKEVVIFDKIVVAVDTQLPGDVGGGCGAMRGAQRSISPTGQGQGQIGSPTASSRSNSPTTPTCPSFPVVPECKCNCLCNCSKC